MKNVKGFIALILTFFLLTISTPAFGLTEGNDSTSNEKKVVYLTFDDGPCEVTLEVLKVLKEENIKGTFFIIGKMAMESPEILKQVQDEGHGICLHSHSHLDKNYSSKEAYFQDYEKCYVAINDITKEEPSIYMRMPGGSCTRVPNKEILRDIRGELVSRGLYYVDWNVSLEDAIGVNIPVEKLIKNFTMEMNKKNLDKSTLMILMHDGNSNKTTPAALKYVIKALKEQGYEFKALNDISQEDHDRLLEKKIMNRHNESPTCDSF